MDESRFSTWTFVILLLVSLILVIHLLFGFFTPAIMAIVIVSLFYPMHRKILLICRDRENLAAFISTSLVLLGVLIPLTFFFIALTDQILTLYQTSQKLTSTGDINTWVRSLNEYLAIISTELASYGIKLTPAPIIDLASRISQQIGLTLYDWLGVVASNLLSLSFNFFLMVALVFIFFASGKATKNFIMGLVPLPEHEKERLVNRFQELAYAVFVGNGLISLLEGLLGAMLFYFFNIPGALIWGVVMSVTAFLPIVGASVVVIPATVYLFLVSDTWSTVIFIILNTLHLSILETIIKTKLIGTKSQMHAVLVFLSVISGVQIYGMFGLFYGPLLVTIFLSLAQLYREHYRNILMRR